MGSDQIDRWRCSARARGPRRGRARILYGAAVLGLTALMIWPLPLGATVEEQRARLPPPAECTDPVEGVWLGHSYTARQKQWYRFTLQIRRAEPQSSKLTGDIESDYWDGGPNDVTPPVPCKAGQDHQLIFMPAKGVFSGGKVQFGGTSWRAGPVLCGTGSGNYFPDNFSGVIDGKTQEFQSVNNDGGYAVNEPTVFRRIRCVDRVPLRPENVTPPPFEPPKRLGCGKW